MVLKGQSLYAKVKMPERKEEARVLCGGRGSGAERVRIDQSLPMNVGEDERIEQKYAEVRRVMVFCFFFRVIT